ncbi:response regulator [Psychromarinibacter sp. S121]|uniref:response regulator n=1 Tax=Psychromarinibacter sp. S121 TaxID=3415127 RepID=UPI003C7A2ED7
MLRDNTAAMALHEFNGAGNAPPAVLILDDQEIDRLRLRRVCGKAGLQPDYSEAATLEQFRAALDRQAYQVIFLDYHLGMETGLDGLKIAKDHALQRDAILIMVTSVGQHDVIIEAMRSGCSDYIIKEELGPEMLRKAITGAFERRILLAALAGNQQVGELGAALQSFLTSSAPELQSILTEMMHGVWRIRNSAGTDPETRKDTLVVTRSCGELARFLDELKSIADGTPSLSGQSDRHAGG